MSDLNHIVFDVRDFDTGGYEVMPVIDGRDLNAIAWEYENARGHTPAGGYAGLWSHSFRVRNPMKHYLGEGEHGARPGSVALMGCDCGEFGCWPFVVEVEAGETRVRWTRWLGPKAGRDYSDAPVLTFDRDQYLRAIQQLKVEAERRRDA